MSVEGSFRSIHSVWRAAAIVLLSAMSAGCDRGYPTKDEPRIELRHMSNVQRISSMNRLGREAGRPHAWSYALENGCLLRVSGRSFEGAAVERTVPLGGMLIEAAFDRDHRVHGVRLKGGSGDGEVALFWSDAWTDAVEMHSLVQSLQAACRAGTRSSIPHRGLWRGLA